MAPEVGELVPGNLRWALTYRISLLAVLALTPVYLLVAVANLGSLGLVPLRLTGPLWALLGAGLPILLLPMFANAFLPFSKPVWGDLFLTRNGIRMTGPIRSRVIPWSAILYVSPTVLAVRAGDGQVDMVVTRAQSMRILDWIRPGWRSTPQAIGF